MKKLKYILPLLLLLTINIATVKSQTKTDSIQFPNENVLYTGLQNLITVSIPGEKLEDIKVICSMGAELKMISWGQYVVEVLNTYDTKDVDITILVKGKPSGIRHYKVLSVPQPYPLFGNISSGKASIKDIVAQSYIYAGLGPDFPSDSIKFIVTKYTLVYIPRGQDPLFFNVTGDTITTRIKAALKDAKAGDTIQVSSIEAAGTYKKGLIRLPSAIAITLE